MLELKQTDIFRKWRERLKDQRVRALIASRLDRLAYGHVGDVDAVGDGVSELRIHHGPGYRIYFTRRSEQIVGSCAAATKAARLKTAKLPSVWRKIGANDNG